MNMDDIVLLDDLALWSGLVAMAVPWLAGVINRAEWAATAKWIVFGLVCLATAAGTTHFTIGIDADNLVRSLLIVATLGSVYYRLWHKPVEQVERSVNLLPAPGG